VAPTDCVDDARSAVRWVRTHASRLGIDPEKIIVSGGSAGGHLAACTFYTDGPEPADTEPNVPLRPAALVLYNPVLNFTGVPMLEERVGKNAEAARRLSPTLHLSKNLPPTLLLYGADDKLLAQGEDFQKRAGELGLKVEMLTAPGVGHGFFNRSPWLERTTVRVDEFLAAHGFVQGPPTVPASLK
jgi:acetyl esterase